MWKTKYSPSQEILSLRSYSTKHFELGNGKRVAILTGLLHAWDGQKFIELPPIPQIEGKLLDKPKKLHKVLDVPYWASCEVQDGGRTILIRDKNNVTIWKHSNVAVYDADIDPYIRDEENEIIRIDKNKVVPSKFVVKGNEVFLEVPKGLKYPLKVDPIVEIGQGTAPDAYIWEKSPDTNYGSDTYLELGGKFGKAQRSIIRFDLSSLPAGSTVTSAKLYLYFYAATGSPNFNIGAHRVNHGAPNYETGWTEAGVTWNKYDGTNNWGTAGGDFNAAATDTIYVPYSTKGWYSWDVTSDCDALEERSWILKTDGETSYYYQDYYSKEYTGDTSLRPYLEVTYEVGGQVYTKELSDTIGPVNDLISKTSEKIPTAETLNIVDSVSTAQQIIRTLTESLNVSDKAETVKQFIRNLQESLSISDAKETAGHFIKTLQESITIVDAKELVSRFVRELGETVSVSDTIENINHFITKLQETLGVSDKVETATQYIRALGESINVSDTKEFVSQFIRDLQEGFGVSDKIETISQFVKRLQESFGISDKVQVSSRFVRTLQESISISDAKEIFSRFVKTLQESFDVSDTVETIRGFSRSLQETLGFSRSLQETLAVSDKVESVRIFIREFRESITVSDTLTLGIVKLIRVSIDILKTKIGILFKKLSLPIKVAYPTISINILKSKVETIIKKPKVEVSIE